MANKKLSELDAVTQTLDADTLYIIASGDSKKITVDSLRDEMLDKFPNVDANVTTTDEELNFVDGVTSAIQDQLDAKADLASPTLTGTPLAPTAGTGTSTTQLATTEFVANTSLAGSLPAQTNNDGKLITTDGTDAAWTPIYDFTDKTANFTAVNGYQYAITAAADLTVTLPSTPTIGDFVGFKCFIASGKTITIAKNGAKIEAVDADMDVNTDFIAFRLTYLNSTKGWILV